MLESKLQSEIVKYLRHKGAYVIKTKPGAGTPTGCPDIIFLFEGAWAAIEVKADAKSKFQPGQLATIEHLSAWSPFVWIAHPFSWPGIKLDLEKNFF